MAPVHVGTIPRGPRIRRARRWPPRPPGHQARWGFIRLTRRALIGLLAAPLAVRVVVAMFLTLVGWSALNWTYQVIRKPAELFFPVSGTLSKTPPETWRQYAPLFRAYSTGTITPEFLAAIAQEEGAGNPVARTYWRWRLSWNPFKLYQPASSAVGMYQITDATFAEAKRYCIHDNAVAEVGRWNDLHACWFNGLYTRVVPSHAIEMTAALLDTEVTRVLERRRVVRATPRQKQDLAAVIHLCGLGGGDAYVRRGFATVGQRCGDHDVAGYLAEVNSLKRQFAVMSRLR
jgi:hypothetical protein